MRLIYSLFKCALKHQQPAKFTRILYTFDTNSKYRNHDHESKYSKYSYHKCVAATATFLWLINEFYERRTNLVLLEKDEPKTNHACGSYRKGLPDYTMDDISSHNTMEKGIWVTYKNGVYDITKFVPEHPGGDQILMAAGSSVEPFWMLYSVHNTKEIYEILEKMRIGNISEQETKHLTDDINDPYGNEPRRHAALKPASAKPFNAETPSELLVASFHTPNDLFYVRNHLPVPNVDAETYELEVEIEGSDKHITLSLSDLINLPKYTISATVMCAGNRRSEMSEVRPVKGLSWGAAAVGNATWTGCRLRDVLAKVGVNECTEGFKHVQFEGQDVDNTGKNYGASIPFAKALDRRGDVILAYEMNGQPLPRDHGFPVRVVVPGVVGARNVKWLSKIVVSGNESDSHWQQNDYKGFSPSTDWDSVDFSKAAAIQELPVTSAICKPQAGQTVEVVDGHILVQGYAWSGGGRSILRVDVTVDEGKTWHVANLDHQDESEPSRNWSWTLWLAKIPVEKIEKVEIWVKAVDSAYNTQPEEFKNIWNLRGVLSNAYHRVRVNLQHP